MAEEKQASIEGQEANLQKSGEEQATGSKKILFIVIGGVLLLIVIIAVVLIIIFSGGEEKGIRGLPEEEEYVNQYNQRMQLSLEPVDKPIYTEPYAYTVNLKNGRNYIHVTLRAVLKDPLAKLYLEARTPEIDDKIITLLKSKMPGDITTRTGLELLKQEFYLEFNKVFPQSFIEQSETKDRTPVKEILVNEYYIQ
ncbi:flagellar basal body-associated FliL family protein [bacterium]|nr:flagellar basal body-associated FliL family protein [bacterium]